ncbi:hypothetical protein CK911_01220 [Aeromonas sp. CU5]|nr:hypothetical protein CK911_01220 [Aeromonas sp. CU5]
MRYGFSTSKILSFSDALASASQNVQENFRVAWIFGPEDLDKNIIFNIFNVHKAIKRYDELILKQISLISSHIQCENIRCEFDMLNQHDKLHPLIDKNEQLQLIDSINDLIFNGEAI